MVKLGLLTCVDTNARRESNLVRTKPKRLIAFPVSRSVPVFHGPVWADISLVTCGNEFVHSGEISLQSFEGTSVR